MSDRTKTPRRPPAVKAAIPSQRAKVDPARDEFRRLVAELERLNFPEKKRAGAGPRKPSRAQLAKCKVVDLAKWRSAAA